jgi:hypothetical protein
MQAFGSSGISNEYLGVTAFDVQLQILMLKDLIKF